MISKLVLENFKRVKNFETDLKQINILVGANNSGKSSVLQGIHFSILAEVVRRTFQRQTIPQQELLYVPASDFAFLRNDYPYSNYSGLTSKLFLQDSKESDDGERDSFEISISKGRNFGNISIQTDGNNPFRQIVTASSPLYSAFVPGLSGISINEELQSFAVVKHGVANGDANLYLRNVLYYIKQDKKIDQLNKLVQNIFSNISIELPYDPRDDVFIQTKVRNEAASTELPMEFCGTGLLQVIQIMAYVLCFSPKLLLLDEPDEHLHPENQRLLAKSLILLSTETDIQIILSTHSRHLLSAFEDEAKFIWLKEGSVYKEDASSEMVEVLLDIGALDGFDVSDIKSKKCVVLTEDQDQRYLNILLEVNGFDLSSTKVFSYKTCTNLEAALRLSDYIHEENSACIIIIHKDRDFMTNEEVMMVKTKANENSFRKLFITQGSDIESYFINPEHIATVFGVSTEDVQEWENELAKENHVEIQAKYQTKRDEIKRSYLYRDNREGCPSFFDLFGKEIPTSPDNRLGKYMLKKINAERFSKYGIEKDIAISSDCLIVHELKELGDVIWK